MRVVCLGDSLTQGTYGGSYVQTLTDLAPEHEIINAGRNGDTVVNLLERLDEALQHTPDLLFVMVGGNDAISATQPATQDYYRRSKNIPDGIVTPALFSQAYRDLLTQVQLAHALPYVGLPPIEYNPTVVTTLNQYNGLTRDVARSLNVPVLDVFARLGTESVPQRPPLDMATIRLIGQRERDGWTDYETEQQRGGYSFTFDGLHLTPAAARQVALWVGEFIGLLPAQVS